jgi:RNA polymerase sigma factor (sigma-70 family)
MGSERDWFQFLSDYWLPVCRFAQQRSALGVQDAEDVAAETFEAILRNQLLQRWVSDHSSKLRTLLCTVVLQILGNRARVQKGRWRLLRKKAHELLRRTDLPTIKAIDESIEHADQFYSAWVESILLRALESLMKEYERNGKADYFRVLHGRVCERKTSAEISQTLHIKTANAAYYYKVACKQLRTKLKELLRENVDRYCDLQDLNAEFHSEWDRIGEYLKEYGGLEQAIAKVYESAGLVELAHRQPKVVTSTACRLAQVVPDVSGSQSKESGLPSKDQGDVGLGKISSD